MLVESIKDGRSCPKYHYSKAKNVVEEKVEKHSGIEESKEEEAKEDTTNGSYILYATPTCIQISLQN